MVASDDELIGEEPAAEEVLVPEAIAIHSRLGQVLDVAAGMVVLSVDSDWDGCGQWWCSLVSRDGRKRARTGQWQGGRRRKEEL
jgi:hypothetical protein